MKFSSRQPEPASMQLAPMIDIVFLLLIFFIVTWQFTRAETELDVSVPTTAEGAELNRPRGEIIINVLKDGAVRVDGTTLTQDELFERLAPIVKLYRNQPVRIRGDREVIYQHIVEVVGTCRRAGIWNISFATQRPEPGN